MADDFKGMIGRFGETIAIVRRALGTYGTNGIYTPGASSSISAVASIQPARGKHLDFLPSAQRTGEEMIMFIDTEVFPSSSAGKTPEDHIEWKGGTFKVLAVRRWEMTQVYWEAIITRGTQI